MQFLVKEGCLGGGNDQVVARLTLEQAMQASANAQGSVGFCWKGDRNPTHPVRMFVKNAECSDKVIPRDNWHTFISLGPPEFEYKDGLLKSGNDLFKERMTMDDALEAASANEAIGFSWKGERHPEEKKVWVILKATEHQGNMSSAPGDGWHTLLKKEPEQEGEILTWEFAPPPTVHEVPGELGLWPASELELLVRAGECSIGFRHDPLPAVLAGLGEQRFVDAEFPPFSVSLGVGAPNKSETEMPPLVWLPAPELCSKKVHSPHIKGGEWVKVSFHNATDNSLQLHWVDQSGEDKPRGAEIAPGGKTGRYSTHATYVWRLRTFEEGEEVFCYTCTADEDQEVIVEAVGGETRDAASPVQLFRNQSCSAEDVTQGKIGDCWLMEAAASAANRFPDSVLECFNPKYISDQGVYSIRLWSPRKLCYVYILVDDYLPTKNGKDPFFAPCNAHGDGMWVALLEKAFAKLQGSYVNLRGRRTKDTPATALCRILQGQPGSHSWGEEEWEDHVASESLWKELVERRLSGKCNVLSTAKGDDPTETTGQDGLVSNHGYTLMDVQEVGGFKLLKIRNVWGRKEWNGDWSDESSLWEQHADVKEQLGNQVADDGIFWIAYPDFVKHFHTIWHN